MDPFREELSLRLRERGYEVQSASLYPYGDWSRKVTPQLLEIARDITDMRERLFSSAGALAVRDPVIRAAESGCTVLLTGHSGGGVTAVQLAAQLVAAGYAPPLVVQIGSPRCPIPAHLKSRTLFMSAVRADGRRSDAVARLGRWSGWARGRGGIPLWKRDAYAPGAIESVALIGGHPDYFRTHASYVDHEGKSNMDRTLHPLLRWFDSRLPSR